MSNTNFNVTLLAQLLVKFSEADKAKSFFIDGGWKRSFYDFERLSDLAEHIAWAVHQAPQNYKSEKGTIRSIEGFMDFIRHEDGTYISEYSDYGQIIVVVENELEAV